MAEHFFKTVYFPRERSRSNKSVRVTLSFPCQVLDFDRSEQFRNYISTLTSRQFRLALGDPYLEDAEDAAEKQMRSFSNHCLIVLLEDFKARHTGSGVLSRNQLAFDFIENGRQDDANDSRDRGVTFRENQNRDVYSWYPYVEGFSAAYVRDTIFRNPSKPRTIYDPFGGSGTTQLAASQLGIRSFYSEVNPLMSFVAETKVNSAAWARENLGLSTRRFEQFLSNITTNVLDGIGPDLDEEVSRFHQGFPERNFFDEKHLRQLLAAKRIAIEIAGESQHLRNLFLLACASNVVHSSHMTRRADLRRRRPDEYKTRVVDVPGSISVLAERMLNDIRNLPPETAEMYRVSDDCRHCISEFQNAFDLALTSPPYLNGTNYFRNTKLELWYLNFIAGEEDLVRLHKRSIVAGINSVSRSHPSPHRFTQVENAVSQLSEKAQDGRIPLLVRQYFSDMFDVLASVLAYLVPGGNLYLDIGDSKFYGVHVPTDVLLLDVAREAGFDIKHRHILAKRYSRDKSDLVQVELVLQKPALATRTLHGANHATLQEKIRDFQVHLPYKVIPYSSRNWGHDLHSLCSYQGKLKPSLAHWVMRLFTEPGDRVLDPLGGVGTVALEAALAGRDAVSNDKSPFASTIAAAKLNPPSDAETERSIERFIDALSIVGLDSEDYASATFGLNGAVRDYYHPETLEEVLKARKLFKQYLALAEKERGDTFLWASMFHVLQGNRPYALSRTSHPITPLAPKGPFVYKSVVDHVERRMRLALREPLPTQFHSGRGLNLDFRQLKSEDLGTFDCIFTSPPFMGMRFDRPNWLRLWFSGWNENDFHKTSLGFLERQQTKSKEVYREFFASCRALVNPGGLVILHLGDDKDSRFVQALRVLGGEQFKLIGDIGEDVQAIEQHGLSDKGNRTLKHHLLFFQLE